MLPKFDLNLHHVLCMHFLWEAVPADRYLLSWAASYLEQWNPRGARVHTENWMCGTDSLADQNHAHYALRHRTILKNKRWLNDGLQERAIRSTQVLWAPRREVYMFSSIWLLALLGVVKISELTLTGGASRVHVTSSDDSHIDRIFCAWSPSLSHLLLRMVL